MASARGSLDLRWCTVVLWVALSVWSCQCGLRVESYDGGFDPWADAGADAGMDAGHPDAGPGGCSACHGGWTNSAPPTDAFGGSERSLRTVGAHQAHLRTGSTWHRDVLCSDCHLVPASVEEPGHIDPSPAEVVFGPLARASGAAPSFDGETCSSYCHGATLGGGALNNPSWVPFDATQAYCGDCHGLPPPDPHPTVSNQRECSGCHPDVRSGLAFSDPQRHVDGVVDLPAGCIGCHGSEAGPAPPRDVAWNTSTTVRTVGAHQSHLGPSSWHAEVPCEECHRVPSIWDDPGHIDPSPGEVIFGPRARARGARPFWNGVSCAGSYCHGGTMDGGTSLAPMWTMVDGTQAQCDSCHGLPPGPPHPARSDCASCHGAVLYPDAGFADGSLHINGLVDSAASCGECHELPPPTGTHLLHAALAPPVYGGLTTAASVDPPPGAYAFGCGHCHPLDPSRHINGGLAEVELHDATAPAGSLKVLTPPSATYTPGGTTYVDGSGLLYTLGTCGNVYCHSGPSYSAPSVPAPGADFPFTGYPIVYPPYVLTISREYQAITWGSASPGCGGCHGYPIRTRAPGVRAMAGQSHSYVDEVDAETGHGWNHSRSPLPCITCHAATVNEPGTVGRDARNHSTYGPLPIFGFDRHVNGRPDVVFTSGLGRSAYSQATATCSSVPCHLAQTSVRSGTPYRYGVSEECNVCHRY